VLLALQVARSRRGLTGSSSTTQETPTKAAASSDFNSTQEKSMNTRSMLIGLCLFGLLASGWSQDSTNTVTPGIPGFLDPQTGSFKPMPLVPEGYSDLSNPAQTGGKIVLTLTTTLTTSFPTGEVFSCGLNATVADIMSGLTFSDTIFVTATKTGNTLNCTVTLPYGWDLASPTQDVMLVLYTINAVNGSGSNPTRVAQHGVASVRGVPTGTTSYTRATVI